MKMKISDAIRLGSAMHPQGFNTLRTRDATGKIIATCALGAAMEAGITSMEIVERLEREQLNHRCPACGYGDLSKEDTVTHLNDYHLWRREAIADWLDTVMTEEPTPATVTMLHEEELVLA